MLNVLSSGLTVMKKNIIVNIPRNFIGKWQIKKIQFTKIPQGKKEQTKIIIITWTFEKTFMSSTECTN